MKRLYIITLLLFAGLLAGCTESGRIPNTEALLNALPPGAQDPKLLGNGWVTFKLDGQSYLFRRTHWDRSASDTITAIPN